MERCRQRKNDGTSQLDRVGPEQQGKQWLGRFRGVVVSGEEGIGKPDPRIFELLLSRFGLHAGRTLFVDDLQVNIDAAERHGFQTLRFTGIERLRAHLAVEGLLPVARR